jgi:hypothetical protein
MIEFFLAESVQTSVSRDHPMADKVNAQWFIQKSAHGSSRNKKTLMAGE